MSTEGSVICANAAQQRLKCMPVRWVWVFLIVLCLTAMVFRTEAAIASSVAERVLPVGILDAQREKLPRLSVPMLRVGAVQVALIADQSDWVPGQPLYVGLMMVHDPGWHTYWRNPGDAGMPTKVEWAFPVGWRYGEIEWPVPKRLPMPPLLDYGYDDTVVLPMQVSVPGDLQPGSSVTVTAQAHWLMCREVCVPGQARLSLHLPVRLESRPSTEQQWFRLMQQPVDQLKVALVVDAPAKKFSLQFPFSSIREAGIADLQSIDAEGIGFFPYHEHLLENAARQVLSRMAPVRPGRGALDECLQFVLSLADEGVLKVNQPPGSGFDLKKLGEGVLVIGKHPFQLVVTSVRQAPLTPGAEIAVTREIAQETGKEGREPPGEAGSGGLTQQIFSDWVRGDGAPSDLQNGARGEAVDNVTSFEKNAVLSADVLSAKAPEAGFNLWILILAFLGGFILNAMPCVFPVVGLKVLSFSRCRTPGAARREAFIFSFGILLCFMAFGAITVWVRWRSGAVVSWGAQLQSPLFVALIALLFWVIGLNLSGLYEFGVSLTRLGGLESAPLLDTTTESGRGWLKSMVSGVLTFLVSTPCIAPFMGTALGYTLSSSLVVSWSIFFVMGVGMASPYIVLGSFPQWTHVLPCPGRWMETLKMGLAFPIYGTVIWLLWVLMQQVGDSAVFFWMVGALSMSFSLWILGRFIQRPTRSPSKLAASCLWGLAALIFSLGGWLILPSHSQPLSAGDAGALSKQEGEGIIRWTPDVVQAIRSTGRGVFVDFTAAWCITCQINKKMALNRPAVQKKLRELRISTVRADWTLRQSEIAQELARWGRNGIPLYLLYPPCDRKVCNEKEGVRMLPQILTESTMLEILSRYPY